MSDEQKPHFEPLGGTETTEDAENEGHDLGVESSAGEPAAAGGLSGSFPDTNTPTGTDAQSHG